MIRIFALIFGLFAPSVFGENVAYPAPNDDKDALIAQVLELALNRSGEAHQFQLQTAAVKHDPANFTPLTSRQVRISWNTADKSAPSNLVPVEIPILKGLLGHKIFLIREGDQGRFDRISSVEDLKRLPAGQARFFRDTEILKSANMNVVDPVKHDNLYKMLEGGRFAYFPRAVHEPWEELDKHHELPLTIEQNLMLVYPYALYFYTHQDDQDLRDAIENGFRAAIEDGSFDQLFFDHPMVKNALEKSNFAARKVFRIHNPDISASSYQSNSELWLNVENL